MVDISNIIPKDTRVEDVITEGSAFCVPDGIYTVKIMDSEIKSAKSNSANKRLIFKVVIIEGDFKHKEFEIGLNIINQNEIARKIAYSEYGQISKACGLDKLPQDTSVLHNIAFNIELKQKKQNDYTDENGVEREGGLRSEPYKYFPAKGETKAPKIKEAVSTEVPAAKKPWE